MSQAIVYQASYTEPYMSQLFGQNWGVAAHQFATNEHDLICGCFTDTLGGEGAARNNAQFIASMFNLREETGLTAEQIRSVVLAAPAMMAAIQAAIDCGMVPNSSAKEGGADRFASQVLAADQQRDSLALAISANR